MGAYRQAREPLRIPDQHRGKSFQSHGEVEWGDGSPKHIGILAKNGGNKEASELDANFEFFELRAPAPERTVPGTR